MYGGFGDKDPGDDLLSHGKCHTTIGAYAFHFRVRDGIGWFHTAIVTRETVERREFRMELRRLSWGTRDVVSENGIVSMRIERVLH